MLAWIANMGWAGGGEVVATPSPVSTRPEWTTKQWHNKWRGGVTRWITCLFS